MGLVCGPMHSYYIIDGYPAHGRKNSSLLRLFSDTRRELFYKRRAKVVNALLIEKNSSIIITLYHKHCNSYQPVVVCTYSVPVFICTATAVVIATAVDYSFSSHPSSM